MISKFKRDIKTNIYPVLNLANPFLGVHYTITVDGDIKIGPTAIPVFWRENYICPSNDFQKNSKKQIISLFKHKCNTFKNRYIAQVVKISEKIKKNTQTSKRSDTRLSCSKQ